jgi:hypothetical protein
MKILGAILLASGLYASSAHASTWLKTMATGTTLEVGRYISVNADCSSTGYATVRVTTAPQHGALTTHKGKGFPYFAAGDSHYDCNMRKADAVLVEYRPEPGFIGTDYVSIDAIFANGGERMDDYQITVK